MNMQKFSLIYGVVFYLKILLLQFKNQNIYWLYKEVKTIMVEEWIKAQLVNVAEWTMKQTWVNYLL